jgi:hypothetical protein
MLTLNNKFFIDNDISVEFQFSIPHLFAQLYKMLQFLFNLKMFCKMKLIYYCLFEFSKQINL